MKSTKKPFQFDFGKWDDPKQTNFRLVKPCGGDVNETTTMIWQRLRAQCFAWRHVEYCYSIKPDFETGASKDETVKNKKPDAGPHRALAMIQKMRELGGASRPR